MSTFILVIIFSLVGGLVSLLGGILLLASNKRAKSFAIYATPFAAGALLAAAFMDLLREATHKGGGEQALLFALIGVLLFFMLERFLRWFHHHHEHDDEQSDPRVPLIVIGDTIHNFVDGIAIAAGFLVSIPTGVVVTVAVAAHEIPQEIGDFGLLLNKGMKRSKVILVNIVSSLATTVAAVSFFLLGQSFDIPLAAMLGLVAGFFIYIAVSDIIPTIHQNEKSLAGWQTAMLLLGVIVVSFATVNLHSYIDQAHKPESELHVHDEVSESAAEAGLDHEHHEDDHHDH